MGKPWEIMKKHGKTMKNHMGNHEKTWKKTIDSLNWPSKKKKSTQIVEEFTETGDRSKKENEYSIWWYIQKLMMILVHFYLSILI